MTTPVLHSKLPATGQTIFTIMSSLASEHKAINLGQGSPDFPVSGELIDLVYKAMKDGHNQYAHRNGLLSLREIITEKIFSLYEARVNPSTEITITPGGTYAIYTALTSVLNPGDEVIAIEPAYDSYVPNILVNGAIPVLIPMLYPEYRIDWEKVKEKISSKTKMIMLNSPHNPTGRILEASDIAALRSIVAGTGIFILSDEVYEHLIFDGKKHESILRYPDLFARSFITFSFGKVFHCTGWKTGYCVSPEPLMKEFLKVHQYNCFSVNTPLQYAFANFLKNRNEYRELGTFFQQKRDLFQNLMKETKFKPFHSSGSYFQLYSYDSLSELSEIDFAKRMTQIAGVATIPVSAFYQNETDHKMLRFCFAKKESTLEEAVKRITLNQDRLFDTK